MITADTTIQILSDVVEIRTPTNHGCQVVKVWYSLPTPRLVAFSEWVTEDNTREQIPMSLRLDEIVNFIALAWAKAGKESSLVSSLQALLSKPSVER